MNWVKRGLIGAALVLGLAFVGFQVFKPQIARLAFERVVEQRAGIDPTEQLEDGLHVYMCGAGSPMPDTSRAGPCVGVIAGKRAFVFDIGSGGARNLGTMGFPTGRLESIYLTHLHSDHIDGLGELLILSWVGGTRTEPTPIIGPVGTQQVVDGFNMAYQIDSTYRVAHHGPDVAPPSGAGGVATEISLPAGPGAKAVVFEDADLKITAIRVSHAPIEPAFGYRIDYKDRSISLSGDTVYHPGFVAASEGVDLMLHEALDPDMVLALKEQLEARGQTRLAKIMHDILDYHASPEEAARAAEAANADALVFYHIVPPLPAKLLHPLFLGEAASEFDGRMTIAEDGMIFSLPAGSDKIQQSRGF